MTPRRCLRSTALTALATAAALMPCLAQAVDVPTELLCGMRTGDITATLRLPAGGDALAPLSVPVGERFVLRALALASPHSPGRIAQVVVTVVDTDTPERPTVLAQTRWPTAGQPVLDDAEAWRPSLSGWQRVYSPALGRELAWGCALVSPGASPAGWEAVDATSDAAVPDAGPPDAARPPRPGAPPPAQAAVRIAWMGDVMLADGPGRLIARGIDPFGRVAAALKAADLRVANLECVIATNGRALDKPWTFRAHPRVLEVLRRHVDAVSVANNHSGDFGPQAFAQMLGRLRQAGLPFFGGGDDLREAHRPVIVERQGLRIALLAYDEMFPRQFEAGPAHPGVAWADDEQIAADIRAARTQADVVIPYMHWGQEHSETAHARQRALARLMIRAGADAVVGTHPHVRQDSETIDGKPVIYSLGNFVFDGFSSQDNNTGSILWMTVTAAGVKDWHLQTVRMDRNGQPSLVP